MKDEHDGILPRIYPFKFEANRLELDPKDPKNPKMLGEHIRTARMDWHMIPPPVDYGGAGWQERSGEQRRRRAHMLSLKSGGLMLLQEQVRVCQIAAGDLRQVGG